LVRVRPSFPDRAIWLPRYMPLHRLTRLLALESYSASARTGERNPQRQRR
jgi:hypothetical protein